jgi:hypothetical protein
LREARSSVRAEASGSARFDHALADYQQEVLAVFHK